ncbi:MAG: hypothetical protein GXO79_12075 [Chlorobi bacterium]|nr:hypothetical protein [Chlorobiota bacterium]
MSEENSFTKDLDKLIELFKRFKEKTMSESIPGFDKQFFQSFDLIVQNYDMIKGHISESYLNQISGPLKQMIKDMINKLQDELGEEINTKTEVSNTIKEIDELLNKPGLSNKEIDELLDKRTSLKTENPKLPPEN